MKGGRRNPKNPTPQSRKQNCNQVKPENLQKRLRA